MNAALLLSMNRRGKSASRGSGSWPRPTLSRTHTDTHALRSAIRAVLLGSPAGTKKKLLCPSAKPERSITLEDGDGRTLLHVECGSDAHRQQLATAFAAYSGAPVRIAQ